MLKQCEIVTNARKASVKLSLACMAHMLSYKLEAWVRKLACDRFPSLCSLLSLVIAYALKLKLTDLWRRTVHGAEHKNRVI